MSPDPSGPTGPGDDGLPDELAKVLRELTGGQDLPPQMIEQLKAFGLADADPQALAAMASQVRAMFDPTAQAKGVDVASATATATSVVQRGGSDTAGGEGTDEGSRDGGSNSTPSGSEDVDVSRGAPLAEQAAHVTGLWLDEVTQLEAPSLRGRALSRTEWVEATMPVWASLVDPVADGLGAAIGDLIGSQLNGPGGPDLEQLSAMGLPPGMDLSSITSQLTPFVGRMASSVITVQLAHAVGTLASEVLTGSEVSLPLLTDEVALLPANIAPFAEGLEVEVDEVWLHLAVRETARMRLFTAVPWLGPQLLAAVQEFARGMSFDPEALESAVRQIDPSDPQGLTEALGGGLFEATPTPAQRAALVRLETWLALIEGWVDVVTERAASPHLPHTAAMAETIRRRRATGGPAEKVFAGLVGLELRPRRLRDAANLFAALEDRLGAAGRDGAWAHPDVAPTTADLDDVLGYVERAAGGGSSDSSDFDAELASLLDDEGPSGPGGAAPSA